MYVTYRDDSNYADLSVAPFIVAKNGSIFKPMTYNEVVSSKDGNKWFQAMEEELTSLHKNVTRV